MKITFIGAAHEVTGSCHCVSACGKNILIDCGMEQGRDDYVNQEIPVSASQVDYVLLTHAHIDHSGLIPQLYARGFRGQIFSTRATADLCNIMLRDSAHIQEAEAEWRNRKGKRAGRDEYKPLYTMDDALGALELFVPCEYGKKLNICEGVCARFSDIGHLLGSASIELWLEEDGQTRKIVFSGDIGNINRPLIKNPQYTTAADVVVMESTYGDRNHKEAVDCTAELAEIIESTLSKGGNLIIPSFAVGRTQEMLYSIRRIKQEGLCPACPDFEVYVDSPLAVEATGVFGKNIAACFDAEAMELVNQGINPIQFDGLKFSVTSDDSKMINFSKSPKVIISASGMCDAGRIRHHLKHNLWRSECTVLFVGYQSSGTLGRMLLDGATDVKLFGEPIEVHARITQLDGVSGHADQRGLLKWINAYETKPDKVFVVHGEDEVCEGFAALLREQEHLDASAPYSGACYDLLTGECLAPGVKERPLKLQKAGERRASAVFDRLAAAGRRLMSVIGHNEGGTNKDLAKFADQINNLCDKWDR